MNQSKSLPCLRHSSWKSVMSSADGNLHWCPESKAGDPFIAALQARQALMVPGQERHPQGWRCSMSVWQDSEAMALCQLGHWSCLPFIVLNNHIFNLARELASHLLLMVAWANAHTHARTCACTRTHTHTSLHIHIHSQKTCESVISKANLILCSDLLIYSYFHKNMQKQVHFSSLLFSNKYLICKDT